MFLENVDNYLKDVIMKLMKWYVTGKQALTIHKYFGIFVLVSAFLRAESSKLQYPTKFRK